MEIKDAKITMLVGGDSTTIKIEDDKANAVICVVTLTPEQLSLALSRTAMVPCRCEVGDLSKIGKTHECQTFEFPTTGGRNIILLIKDCEKHLQENNMSDWTPDRYFSSQNSFFNKNGEHWARVTIRRWI